MGEAILLTICICGTMAAIAFERADHNYNKSMQSIFGKDKTYSLLDTPWISGGTDGRD